jgi:hypothetical protein
MPESRYLKRVCILFWSEYVCYLAFFKNIYELIICGFQLTSNDYNTETKEVTDFFLKNW